MQIQVILVSILFTISVALLALMVFVYTKKNRAAGIIRFELLFGANVLYILGYALEVVCMGAAGKILFNHVQYLGLPLILPFWYMLCVQFKDKSYRWTVKKALPILIIPLITIVLNLTHEWNGIFYASYSLSDWHGIGVLIFQKGMWYYVEVLYHAVLSVLTISIYAKIYKGSGGIRKRQSLIMLIISVFGLCLSVSSMFGTQTAPVDFVAVLLSIASVLMFVTLFKYELFDLVPLAYSKLFEALDQPIVILTDAMAVVKVNPAAQHVFSDRLGQPGRVTLSELIGGDACCIDKIKNNEEYLIEKQVHAEPSYFSAKLIRLFFSNKTAHKSYGYLLVLSDVTSHINQVRDLAIEAAVDVLTGLYNRRYFYSMAGAAIEKAKKQGEPLSLIMLDIDHFKEVNDLHGHQAGDYVLQALSEFIRGQLRESDIIARYGGEEFVVLLPATDIEAAASIADRICIAVRESNLAFEGRHIPLAVSIGVSSIALPENQRIDSFIALADSALYDAKSAGRDRVVVRKA